MFELVVYKTQTGNIEDFILVDTKQFNTFKQAEAYADTKYDLSPVGDGFPGEYTNSNDTIGKIEKF